MEQIQPMAARTAVSVVMAAAFADPEWRGDRSLHDRLGHGRRRRICARYSRILEQQRRIMALIRAGEARGVLDAYQARRAGFDLQSIRVQAQRELARGHGDADARRAIQSRLDRLEACLMHPAPFRPASVD